MKTTSPQPYAINNREASIHIPSQVGRSPAQSARRLIRFISAIISLALVATLVAPPESHASSGWNWNAGRVVIGPTAIVAPFTTKDVFAACAATEVAVGGGYTEPGNATQNAVVLVNSMDTDPRRWFVRVKNDSPAPLTIQAQASCLPASAYISNVTGPTEFVAPGGVKDVFATCPSGKRVLGGGYVQPGNATQNGLVLVNAIDPTVPNRWFVRVKNDSSNYIQVRAQAACSSPAAWETNLVNGPLASVAPYSVKDVFAECPSGFGRYSGGYIEPGNASQKAIILSDAFDTNLPRWFIRVKNNSSSTLTIQAQVTCWLPSIN